MNREPKTTVGGDSNASATIDTRSKPTSSKPEDASGSKYAAQRTGDAVKAVKDTAGQQADQIKRHAKEATAQAKQKAKAAASQAKESGRQYAAEKKTRVADEIGVFSGAIRKASSKLHDEQHDSIASYVDAAAEKLDELRESLQSKEVGELIGDAQEFARRRPEIVYGGLFVAGLAAMRFLKASTPESSAADRSNAMHSQAPNPQSVSSRRRPIGYRGQGTLNPIGQRDPGNKRDSEGGASV